MSVLLVTHLAADTGAYAMALGHVLMAIFLHDWQQMAHLRRIRMLLVKFQERYLTALIKLRAAIVASGLSVEPGTLRSEHVFLLILE